MYSSAWSYDELEEHMTFHGALYGLRGGKGGIGRPLGAAFSYLILINVRCTPTEFRLLHVSPQTP